MPCALTADLTQACPLPKAGAVKFSIIEINNISALTIATTGITGGTLVATKTFKVWSVTEPDMIFASSDRASHRDAGVADTFNHKVGIKIPGIAQTISNEIDGQNPRFAIAIKANDGKTRLYGWDRGLVIKKDTETTGTKTGDFNGYEIEFEGEQFARPYEITTAGMTALGLT